MSNVTAAMVKELREKTGAGMMDCKAALNETKGDIEGAIDWLRKKGLSKAAKKSGRVAAEGLVAVAVRGNDGVVIEVNSETDFVARNEDFQALVRSISLAAFEHGVDVPRLLDSHYPGSAGTVADALTNAIATIGENISLRRAAALHVKHGVISSYTHNAIAENLGKIGVIVALESTGNKDALNVLARQIALHIAAANPVALNSETVDPAVILREKQILADKNSGKPANVLEKIIDSGMKSYFKEVCLIDQVSIHAEHAGKSIRQVVKDSESQVGAPISLSGYHRFALGDGIEKPEEPDFAAEVASMAG